MTNNLSREVSAETLVDLQVPRDVRISPSATHVVYSANSIARSGDHVLSSLWIGEVGKKHSARQLTSGFFNDQFPQWNPVVSDTNEIAFISDRAKQGESSAIYVLPISGGEAYPVSKADNKKKIAKFAWSPDGKFIAFTNPDEKSPEQEAREKGKDDAKVYGQNWEYNHLRCLHVATRDVFTLVENSAHVTDFAWKDDSSEIAYITQKTPDLNSAGYNGVKFEKVNVSTGEQVTICGDFPGPARDLVWSEDKFYFVAGVTPNKVATAAALYELSITGDRQWSRTAFGLNNTVASVRQNAGNIWIQSQDGLYDGICRLNDHEFQYLQKCEISPWYAVNWDAIDSGNRWSTLGVGESSCASSTEIYTYQNGGDRRIHSGDQRVQVSNHSSHLANYDLGQCQALELETEDGQPLDGIFIKPARTKSGRLPTVVLIHGGPYSRISDSFNVLYFYWGPYLVSAGYGVLCPNYRGGSTQGEDYASQARAGMGTKDYDDVIALVKAAISKDLVDENNLAIGGYSQGGFLSYLAVTRSDLHFKAAICGGGIVDWDMMSMTSDAPWFESECAGKAPWETTPDDVGARRGSAIWNMKNVKTPILILHGEEDARVPSTQAIAFHRGCLHHGIPCEFVTYPREKHIFEEKAHMIDMLKRIRRFVDLHLRS